jgi:hypothetical protein
MKYLTLLASLLFVICAANLSAQSWNCTTDVDSATYEKERQYLLSKMQKNSERAEEERCSSPYWDCLPNEYTIPVVFHVLTNPDGNKPDPIITDMMLEDLIVKINQNFAGTNFLSLSITYQSKLDTTNLSFVCMADFGII